MTKMLEDLAEVVHLQIAMIYCTDEESAKAMLAASKENGM